MFNDASVHSVMARLADLARSGPDRQAPLGRQCSPDAGQRPESAPQAGPGLLGNPALES